MLSRDAVDAGDCLQVLLCSRGADVSCSCARVVAVEQRAAGQIAHVIFKM